MILAGRAVLALLGLIIGGALLALMLRAAWPPRFAVADLAVLRLTLVQASLSAALSVVVATPLARALARRRFPGRDQMGDRGQGYR